MKNIDFSINDTIRKDGIKIHNLAKLGQYVQAHVTDKMFTMEHFYKLVNKQTQEWNICNTIGCLLGYSPRALEVKLENTTIIAFDRYSKFSRRHYNITPSSKVYSFLFAMNWHVIDNSREGALKRIKFVIDHDDYNYGEISYVKWLDLYSTVDTIIN